MGQREDIRMSMALESGLRDVPLAAALILTCFDGLPATIITPALSIVYVLGYTVALPGSLTTLFRTVQMWRSEEAWSDANNSIKEATPVILGLQWADVGKMRPVQGREIKNQRLEHVLPFRSEFTAAEWVGFGIDNLQENDFIQSGEVYFKLEMPTIEASPAKRSSMIGMLFPRVAVCGFGRQKGKRQMGMALL